jgi:REP element-mobilizing transposase RayT
MSDILQGRTITVRRRNLPHWTTSEGTYFVTFRLKDALPVDVARRLAVRRRRHLTADRLLDRGWGSSLLNEPRLADVVESAVRHFNGERYKLHCYSVMPNHVHVVLRTLHGVDLQAVLKSWKGFSSRTINRLTGRSGALWQDETYDTLLHDANDLRRAVDYVARNPYRAGLRDWRWTGVLDTRFRFRDDD